MDDYRMRKVTSVNWLMVHGLRKRGDAVSDPDFDRFIECPVVAPDLHRRICGIAWEVRLVTDMGISVLAYRQEWAGQPKIKAFETDAVEIRMKRSSRHSFTCWECARNHSP
jgi:hypothetical protein